VWWCHGGEGTQSSSRVRSVYQRMQRPMQPAWMVVCGLSCKTVDLDLGTALRGGGLSVTSGASQHKEQCSAPLEG
jgi:hypothetical protein